MPSKKRPVLTEIVSVQELASMLLISERQIQRLTAQGTLALTKDGKGRSVRGRYALGDAVARYVKHLRESMAHNPEQKLYESARTRRMDAIAEREELALKLQKGQLHHASDIEFVMTKMLSSFRQRVLAIPSRISRTLIGKTSFREIHDPLNEEIYACLRELSGYDPNTLEQQAATRLASQGVNLTAQRAAEATRGS